MLVSVSNSRASKWETFVLAYRTYHKLIYTTVCDSLPSSFILPYRRKCYNFSEVVSCYSVFNDCYL